LEFTVTVTFNLKPTEPWALGGINEKNFNQLKILNITGLAMSSDKKKAGNYLPAFYKN